MTAQNDGSAREARGAGKPYGVPALKSAVGRRVRLEKPKALAEALLANDPKWTADTIAAAIDKGDTLRVRLTDQVPVFIFYWTAFASPDGSMNFRSDPYSWDRLLLQRIGVLDAPKV